jgi:hypothetical protein
MQPLRATAVAGRTTHFPEGAVRETGIMKWIAISLCLAAALAAIGCDDPTDPPTQQVSAYGRGHGHPDESEQQKIRDHYADNGLVDFPDSVASAAVGGMAAGSAKSVDAEAYLVGVPILNQGSWSSCVSNAAALALCDALGRSGISTGFLPSIRYEWYNARMELYANANLTLTGTWMKNVFEAINDKTAYGYANGVPAENQYPCGVLDGTANAHDASYWNDMSSYTGGEWSFSSLQVSYRSIALYATPDQVKAQLDAGKPVMFSMMVGASFEATGPDGVVTLPYTWTPLDGHCMLIVGYDDAGYGGKYGNDAEGVAIGAFKVRNSWGSGWGDGGYWYMPYLFLTDYPPASPTNPFNGNSPLNNGENFVYIDGVSVE